MARSRTCLCLATCVWLLSAFQSVTHVQALHSDTSAGTSSAVCWHQICGVLAPDLRCAGTRFAVCWHQICGALAPALRCAGTGKMLLLAKSIVAESGAHMPPYPQATPPRTTPSRAGTGKTLLAKSIAAESGVRMFTCSGTDFYDMYSGVGARRIRETFEKLRNNVGAARISTECKLSSVISMRCGPSRGCWSWPWHRCAKGLDLLWGCGQGGLVICASRAAS